MSEGYSHVCLRGPQMCLFVIVSWSSPEFTLAIHADSTRGRRPFCPPHSDTWLFLPHICLDASGVVFSLLFQYDSWPWVLGCSLTRTEKGWKAQSWRDVHEANCWLIHDHNHWNEIVSIASSVFVAGFLGCPASGTYVCVDVWFVFISLIYLSLMLFLFV